jgi:hypothetical protein
VLEEWCDNSQRWIAFMIPSPPKSCPYATPQNGHICVADECGYYRMREASAEYRRKAAILFTGPGDFK